MESQADLIGDACRVLSETVDAMPDGTVVSGPYFAQWPTIGRDRIKSWISDLESVLRKASELWRLDAADDRLGVILSLALGVRVLKVSKNQKGVDFRPDRGRLISMLKNLSGPAAASLTDAMERWFEHPARVLRHEVTHSLSQTAETQPLVDLDVRFMRGGVEAGRQAKMLYPDDLHLETTDIRPEAVWQRVVGHATTGLDAILACVSAAAITARAYARLEPPPAVYYDLDLERVALEP